MDITPLISDKMKIIEGYGQDGFRISGTVYKEAISVMPTLVMPWPDKVPQELVLEDFEPLLEVYPEVELILLGCGAQILPVTSGLRAALKARNVGIDCLDTGSACRTYNVLLSEERRVAAILTPTGV